MTSKKTDITAGGGKMPDSVFMTSADVQALTGYKGTKSWEIIKRLNEELEQKGFLTVKGKVPRKYFMERFGLGVKA
jgi:hypothetical protein